jgi:hypothetical protein
MIDKSSPSGLPAKVKNVLSDTLERRLSARQISNDIISLLRTWQRILPSPTLPSWRACAFVSAMEKFSKRDGHWKMR